MIYYHPNLEGRLRIKKINQNIVVVEEIDKPKEFNVKGEMKYPVSICRIENLSKENQMKLF